MIPHSKNKTKPEKRFLNKPVDFFLDLLFPKFCFGCKKEGAYLCIDCKNRLRGCHSEAPAEESLRFFTAPPTGGSVQHDKSSIYHHPFCPACKNKIVFPQKCAKNCKSQIKLALSPFSYDNFLIKDLIHNFKYNFVKSLGIDLADFMIESLKKSPICHSRRGGNPENYNQNMDPRIRGDDNPMYFKNFLIVPVPLHRRRLAWRGFNQSEILAKEISQALNIEFSNALKRVKNTKPQIDTISADERQKNIENAFALRRPALSLRWAKHLSLRGIKCWSLRGAPFWFSAKNQNGATRQSHNNILNKTIILVDDMITTGATLEECAKILKQAGAKEVWAITIAK